MPSVLILEDDQLTSERLQTLISNELEELGVSTGIEIIETERDFRKDWMERLRADKVSIPDVIVIDIMLLWCFPSPDSDPRPPDVIEGGFHMAGIRCFDAICAEPKLRRTKKIFYTALTKVDLEEMKAKIPSEIPLITKDQDGIGVARLIKSWLS